MKRTFFLTLILASISVISCTNEGLEAPVTLKVEDLIVETELEAQTVELVNNFRRTQGLPELSLNAEAYKAAFDHTVYMAQKGKISHSGFDSRARELAAKVNAILVAENVSTNYENAEETLQRWLDSPGHRKNIVGNFSHTGLAVVRTPDGDVYYTQIFFLIEDN